jgi:dihydroorotate dehydrogenase (NAD+) catalytic subunit
MPKYDFSFDPPLMNATGMLGFAPDPRGPFDLGKLGAFVTNPISARPRAPAQRRGFLAYPGGFLLHSGYPNPGLSASIRRYGMRWARSPVPVIVHLLAEGGADLAGMVARLERIEGIAGIELGIPADCRPGDLRELLEAAGGELPIIVRLPLERADELAEALVSAGSSDRTPNGSPIVSLGPPRGAFPEQGIRTAPAKGEPTGEQQRTVHGRLYGPSLYPLALAAVCRLARLGLQVIGGGGVYNAGQAEAMLACGAIAVHLDAVIWRLGWD